MLSRSRTPDRGDHREWRATLSGQGAFPHLPCETRSFSVERLKLPTEVFPYQQTWQDTVVDARADEFGAESGSQLIDNKRRLSGSCKSDGF